MSCIWRSKDVVELMERLELKPLTEIEQMVLIERAATYAEVKSPKLEASHCPCGNEQVSPTDASPHALECPRHPGRVHYQRLSRLAERWSTRHGKPNDLEAAPALVFPSRPADADFVQRMPFAEAVALLGRADASPEKRRDAAWSVRAELRWRMHVAERETDPCPWCARVFPLETFTAHLWSCDQHPGTVRGVVLADALRERMGESSLATAIEEDRELEARAIFETFIKACQTYAGDMGYLDGDTYYSKVWSEKPWRRAMGVADAFAREEARSPMSPGLGRLITALTTLLAQSLRFWNGMGDDGDGRSLIRADDSRAWEAQVAEAEAVLRG